MQHLPVQLSYRHEVKEMDFIQHIVKNVLLVLLKGIDYGNQNERPLKLFSFQSFFVYN